MRLALFLIATVAFAQLPKPGSSGGMGGGASSGSGVQKGNGSGGFSAATAGTDFEKPITITAVSYHATDMAPACASGGGDTLFTITLTGNVTSFTAPSGCATGQRVGFQWTQDGTGGRTAANWPAGFESFDPVDTTASKRTTQWFVYNGSTFVPQGKASYTATTAGIILASGNVVAIPDANGTMATIAGSQTLTNKTIDGDDNTVQDLATSSLKTKTASYTHVAGADGTPSNGCANWSSGKLGSTGSACVASSSTIGSGAYSSLPATCTTGDLYFPTSGEFDTARCTATNTWTFLVNGRAITPAAQLTGLSNTLQASVTQATTNGYGLMTLPNGTSTTASYWTWTVPSAPHTTYLVVQLPFFNTNAATYTIVTAGFMDNANDQSYIRFGTGQGVVSTFWWQQSWGNAGGFTSGGTATAFSDGVTVTALFGRVLIKLVDDNTNFTWSICSTKDNCTQLGSTMGRTAHQLAPTKLFLGAFNSGGSTVQLGFVGVLQ